MIPDMELDGPIESGWLDWFGHFPDPENVPAREKLFMKMAFYAGAMMAVMALERGGVAPEVTGEVKGEIRDFGNSLEWNK